MMPCSKEILDTYSGIRRRSILVNSSSTASNWSSTSSASSTTSPSSSSGIFLVLFDDIVQRHIYFLDLRSHFVLLPVASCVFKWRDEKIMGYGNVASFTCPLAEPRCWRLPLLFIWALFLFASLFVWTFRHSCKSFIFLSFFLQRWHQRFRPWQLARWITQLSARSWNRFLLCCTLVHDPETPLKRLPKAHILIYMQS